MRENTENLLQSSNRVTAVIVLFCSLLLALVSFSVHAKSDGEKFNEGVNYINLPRFYANFGDPHRKQFAQVEISLRTESAQAASIITHHLPLVRDRILRIISQQSEQVLQTTEGRDLLRAAAIKMINQAITEVETGDKEASLVAYISDVYFTNFILQR